MNIFNVIFEWLGYLFGYIIQFAYLLFKNYGAAILFFTVVSTLLRFPLTIYQQKQTAAQARIQPKIREAQEKYKNDRTAQGQAIQEIQQKEGVSQLAGCLPMLIQFPLLFGLMQAIYKPFTCVMHLPKDLVDRLAAILNVTTMTRDEMSLVNAIRSLVSCETGFITINRMGRLVGTSGQGGRIAQNAALSVLDGHKSVSLAEITDVLSNTLGAARAASVLDMTQSFNFFGIDLLSTPKFWNAAIIISLLTFIFAAGGMVLSNMINKEMTPQATGCSPNLMAVGMGGMSFFISLSVPAALALYWGANSAIAPLQTWVIKKYFGPDRINAMDEARRLARMKQNEKALYDDVTGEKGKLALSPDPLPEIEDRAGGKKKKNNKK